MRRAMAKQRWAGMSDGKEEQGKGRRWIGNVSIGAAKETRSSDGRRTAMAGKSNEMLNNGKGLAQKRSARELQSLEL